MRETQIYIISPIGGKRCSRHTIHTESVIDTSAATKNHFTKEKSFDDFECNSLDVYIHGGNQWYFYIEYRGNASGQAIDRNLRVNDVSTVVYNCMASSFIYEVPEEMGPIHTCGNDDLPDGKYNISIYALSHIAHSRGKDLLHVSNYSVLKDRIFHHYRMIHSFEWTKKHLTHSDSDAQRQLSHNHTDEASSIPAHNYWYFSQGTETALLDLGFSNYTLPSYTYSGYDRGMNKQRVLDCLSSQPFLLVGDSRMLYQRMHINRYLGGDLVKFLYLNADPYPTGPDLNMYFGLDAFFKLGLDAIVFEHLLGGGTVLVNSLLHDLIDFGERQLTQQIRQIYGIGSCGTCIGNTSYCNCQVKQNAIQTFKSNVRKLSSMVKSCPQQCGKLIWVSFGIKPPKEGWKTSRGHIWLLHDVLYHLESFAGESISSADRGYHLDLRELLGSCEASWWSDNVHYGKADGKVDFDYSTIAAFATNKIFSFAC